MINTIRIRNRIVGAEAPCFIVAEAGVNHNGSVVLAKQLIDVAAHAGADAVKFQTYQTADLILEEIEKPTYQQRTTDSNESQTAMLKRL